MSTDLPKKIHLDLDAAERPADEVKEPYTFTIAGREITMIDPGELDWQDLLFITNPMDFLRYALSSEDRDFLLDQKVPGWKFGLLMEGFYKHYDLEKKVEDAKRRERLQGL